MAAKILISDEMLKQMLTFRQKDKLSYEEIGRRFKISSQTVKRNLLKVADEDELDATHKFNEHYFYEIDSADKAYWLGFITADGTVLEQNMSMTLKLTWSDNMHIVKFVNAIQGDFEVSKQFHTITSKPIAYVSIYSDIFVRELVEKMSGFKKEDRKPFDVPEEFLCDYIRGLWDADGCIRHKHIDLSGNFETCLWTQERLIEFCGIPKTKMGFESNRYRIYVSRGKIDVLKWMYYPMLNKDIVLERKYKQAKLLILHSIRR